MLNSFLIFLISGANPGNYKDLDTQINSNSNVRIVDGALVLKNIQKVMVMMMMIMVDGDDDDDQIKYYSI